MARGRSGAEGPRHVKGFRPGKEPPQIRKREATARIPDDAPAVQKWLVEALVERGPEGVQQLIGKFGIGLAVAGAVLAIGGALLYRWHIWAGVLVQIIAAVALFLWYRVRAQRGAISLMAKQLGLDRRPAPKPPAKPSAKPATKSKPTK
jgi:hypothetical protein